MISETFGSSAGGEFQQLETALIRAGRTIAYPATPPIAARVRVKLDHEPAPRPFWSVNWNAPRLAFTFALALVIALVLLLIYPDTREAIAQLLGLRTIRIIEVRPTSTAPGETPVPTATPGVAPFTRCCATTLADAQRRARFPVRLPRGETPSQVFYSDVFDAQQVVLVFGDPNAPRYTLYQAQRWVYEKMVPNFSKEIGAGTVITETVVNGARALWLSGAPHILVTLDPQGTPVVSSERPVSANTLVWETGPDMNAVTYRLETTLSLQEAIRIAESLVEPNAPPKVQCCETTLADARTRARFQLVVPPDQVPSKVYYQKVFDEGEQVILIFGDPKAPRFTLYQAQKFVYEKLIEGGSPARGTVIAETQVNGQRALWLSGAPHVLVTLNASGEPTYRTERVVEGNTLIWETSSGRNAVTMRLETQLSIEEAVRFAESLQ